MSDPTLVAYYAFNDGSGVNATDSSGNSRTLALSGTPAWTTAGRLGGALILDGIDDRAQGNMPFATTSTLAAWVKFSAFPINQCLIFGYSQINEPSAEFSTVLGIDATGHVLAYCFDGGTKRLASAGVISLGTWYHIAATFSNGVAQIVYINGVAQGSLAIGTQYNSWSSGPVIKIGGSTGGTDPTSFNNFATCVIDEGRIYNRVLPPAELLSLANPSGPRNTSQLIIGLSIHG